MLYRHEPDEWLPEHAWAEPAQQIAGWIRQRGLRSAAKRPLFRKSWRPLPLALTRNGIILTLAAAQRFRLTAKLSRTVNLPDLVAPGRRASMRAAVKLVNWDGGHAVANMPHCRCCFILRHPCGQVASVLAGRAERRFAPAAHGGSIATTDPAVAADFAERRGVSATAFARLPDAAKLAWSWLAFNEPAVDRLRHQPNARIVVYEDLCKSPEAVAKALFAFAGLSWQQQSSNFIATSTSTDRSSDYYDVFRSSLSIADRWRQTMKQQDQDAVRAVVGTSPLASYWPDLAIQAGAEPHR